MSGEVSQEATVVASPAPGLSYAVDATSVMTKTDSFGFAILVRSIDRMRSESSG